MCCSQVAHESNLKIHDSFVLGQIEHPFADMLSYRVTEKILALRIICNSSSSNSCAT